MQISIGDIIVLSPNSKHFVAYTMITWEDIWIPTLSTQTIMYMQTLSTIQEGKGKILAISHSKSLIPLSSI